MFFGTCVHKSLLRKVSKPNKLKQIEEYAMDRDHYFLRGTRPVTTSSSILVSSSKYLNNPRLRDWVAMISLRQNGQDLPAAAELVELFDILHDLRDYERIESLFS